MSKSRLSALMLSDRTRSTPMGWLAETVSMVFTSRHSQSAKAHRLSGTFFRGHVESGIQSPYEVVS